MSRAHQPAFYDAWLFLTGNTSDHAASGVGWLLTVLYLALLIGSIAIAYRNWRQSASQRTMEHLDPSTRTGVLDLLHGIARSEGVAVVCSLHQVPSRSRLRRPDRRSIQRSCRV
jgi:hypothetical protein